MKTYLDCFPCFLRQALDTTRLSTDDEKIQKLALIEVMTFLVNFFQSNPDEVLTPPHITFHIYRIVKEVTNCKNPYHDIKVKYNEIALNMYSSLKNIVKNSSDSLLTAIRLAIAGNVIDFGAGVGQFDLEATLKETLTQEFAIYHYDLFCNSLKSAKTLLYLGDNAGEVSSEFFKKPRI